MDKTIQANTGNLPIVPDDGTCFFAELEEIDPIGSIEETEEITEEPETQDCSPEAYWCKSLSDSQKSIRSLNTYKQEQENEMTFSEIISSLKSLPKGLLVALKKILVRKLKAKFHIGQRQVKKPDRKHEINPLFKPIVDTLKKISSSNETEALVSYLEFILKIQDASKDGKVKEFLNHKYPELLMLLTKKEFQEADQKGKIIFLLQNIGISSSKIAQILSEDESTPTQLTDILETFKSQISPTRNLRESQDFVDSIYGEGKYSVIKQLGSGTIGETVLAIDNSQEEVVIKMLRNNVSVDKLNLEEAVW